jgi:hypothetical protein
MAYTISNDVKLDICSNPISTDDVCNLCLFGMLSHDNTHEADAQHALSGDAALAFFVRSVMPLYNHLIHCCTYFPSQEGANASPSSCPFLLNGIIPFSYPHNILKE